MDKIRIYSGICNSFEIEEFLERRVHEGMDIKVSQKNYGPFGIFGSDYIISGRYSDLNLIARAIRNLSKKYPDKYDGLEVSSL